MCAMSNSRVIIGTLRECSKWRVLRVVKMSHFTKGGVVVMQNSLDNGGNERQNDDDREQGAINSNLVALESRATLKNEGEGSREGHKARAQRARR